MDKRILIIIPTLSLGGGAEKIASILGKQLRKGNREIIYQTFYDFEPKYPFEGRYFTLYERTGTPLLKKPIKIFLRAREIAKLCQKERINIVISFLDEANFSTVLSKFFFNNNARIIVSIHNSIEHQSLIRKVLFSILYPMIDLVVPITKEMESQLRDKCKVKNIYTIYNMHYIDKYIKSANDDVPSTINHFFDNSYVFVNMGRLTKQKGQCFLIRSFKKVVARHNKAKLIVLGDGELRNQLVAFSRRLKLDKHIFFIGSLENIFPILKHSDCFVFSSLFEGLPNSLIEALAMNLPIISTDCKTGPREILAPDLPIGGGIEYPYFGEYGILTSPFKKEMVLRTIKEEPLVEEEIMFSDLMIRMIEDNQMRETFSSGLMRARDFDANIIAGEWEKIL